MQPGQLQIQNKVCKRSPAVTRFSELLGIVHRKQGHTEQDDDVIKLCKHTFFFFPENLSALAKTDAVLLEVLLKISSIFLSHLEKGVERTGTLMATEHKEDEHLNY